MLTITHLLVGAASVGMAAQTTNPVPILIGAIASLLPDIDISTSSAGRVLPFISRPLEQRFSHRSATHSLLASITLATVTYGLWFAIPAIPLVIVHALNIGYFAGWFLDCFTKSGVEMFYPLGVRCVCPGNRNLRISTGSAAEYWLMVFVVAIAVWTFQLNNTGGLVKNFNALIAAPSGVTELYNRKGGNQIVYAEYEGVWTGNRAPVTEEAPIIATNGEGFLVLQDDQVVKVGTEADSTIIVNRIRGREGEPAVIHTETIYLDDEPPDRLEGYINPMTFISGQLTIDDPTMLRLEQSAFAFAPIRNAGGFVTLDHAPIETAIHLLQDQYVRGSVTIKTIEKR
ncbi:metal-dependent hydrolase [Synechocystis salina]|uniref:Metal-dependent hydrolase n=1 Tax=Synechocystis salina LEGE 00031 TaxID=1828736 RepID=A0ABR9VRA0_9SYNC|nr:metal-dependent hydrolase [Synechocystis salina]MBE9242588.1 metal-dependent hydrolase [Synechocystis salina LEGE 00041]MBE9253879.1 metal-dependent hydrolase [Synechocystis salina LEGE 00031]